TCLPGGLVLAGCCDGVGTKVEVAKAAGDFAFLGQDLVAMNVNDLVTCGARPLFFLDYIACGKLDRAVLTPIVKSIAAACAESGCALLGGETAEMPGTYGPEGLDLAGFAVGLAEEGKILDGSAVQKGDAVVGVPSSGVHSNGFSLVRRALLSPGSSLSLHDRPPLLGGQTLGDCLLTPTKLYVSLALKALSGNVVHAMAHITGGGLFDNIVRVIPKGFSLSLKYDAWPRPAIFSLLAERDVEEDEMRSVFNLGIGFVFLLAQKNLPDFLALLEKEGEKGYVIGEVTA
ncbi:MAG: phosphoribosylformylglycinamidine cyclo-ligase, partial [Synergistaceae bacterium]|nr:phosphoribosylformylglycinamidine cyclo-ligase [Synergistaceae bacterium]